MPAQFRRRERDDDVVPTSGRDVVAARGAAVALLGLEGMHQSHFGGQAEDRVHVVFDHRVTPSPR
jgi:hypothetical protein